MSGASAHHAAVAPTAALAPASLHPAGTPLQQHEHNQGVLDLVGDLHMFELQLGLLRQQAHKLAADRLLIDQQLQHHPPQQCQQLPPSSAVAATAATGSCNADAAQLQQQLAQDRAGAAAELGRLRHQGHKRQELQQQEKGQEQDITPSSSYQQTQQRAVDATQWLQAAPADANGSSSSNSNPLKRTVGSLAAIAAATPGEQPTPAAAVQPEIAAVDEHADAEPVGVKRPRLAGEASAAAPAAGDAEHSAAGHIQPADVLSGRTVTQEPTTGEPAAEHTLRDDPSTSAAQHAAAAANGGPTPLQPPAAQAPGRDHTAGAAHAKPPHAAEQQQLQRMEPASAATNTSMKPQARQQQPQQPQLKQQQPAAAAGARDAASIRARPAGSAAGAAPPAAGAAAAVSSPVTLNMVFAPLSLEARTAALVELEAAASAAANAPMPSGPKGTQRLLADAATARRLVEQLCPAVAMLVSIVPQQATTGLQRMEVAVDSPPRWTHASGRPPCEAQLLCKSGLKGAVQGIYLPSLKTELLKYADKAAGNPGKPGGAPGSGLRDFFWTAHAKLLKEVNSPVQQSLPAKPALGRQCLKQTIQGRVGLAELLLLTFNLLVRGRLWQGEQQPAAQAASSAAAAVERGLDVSQQQQQVLSFTLKFRPLTPSQTASAQEHLKTKAKEADRVAASAAGRLLAADSARRLLMQFCPAAAAVMHLTPAAAGQLHKLQVEQDCGGGAVTAEAHGHGRLQPQQPPDQQQPQQAGHLNPWGGGFVQQGATSKRQLHQQDCDGSAESKETERLAKKHKSTHAAGGAGAGAGGDNFQAQDGDGGLLHEAQLLKLSGLLAACGPLANCSDVLASLPAAARRAACGSNGTPGSGLLGFFWEARQLLVQEVQTDIVQPVGCTRRASHCLKQRMLARVYLVELLLLVYGLLRRGQLQQSAGPDAAASASAAAAALAAATAAGTALARAPAHTATAAATRQAPSGSMAQQQQQQQQQQQNTTIAVQPLSAAALAAAKELLKSAAAAAAAVQPGGNAERVIANGPTMKHLVRTLFPAVDALAALSQDQLGQLPNLYPLLNGVPDRSGGRLHEAVFVSEDGLIYALRPLRPSAVYGQLEAAVAAAAEQHDGSPGTGLRGFFVAAHAVFVAEVGAPARLASETPLSTMGVDTQLRQLVSSRVFLAELLAVVYNLLQRGQPLPHAAARGQQQQQPSPGAWAEADLQVIKSAGGAALQQQSGHGKKKTANKSSQAAAHHLVSDANTMQQLVTRFCPQLLELLALRQSSMAGKLRTAALSTNDFARWQGASPAQLQIEQLFSTNGLRAACVPIKQRHVLSKLDAAVSEAMLTDYPFPATGLHTWFWAAHSALLDDSKLPVFVQLDKGTGQPKSPVDKTLEQAVLSRVYWAQLLLLVYRLMKDGSVTAEQVEAVRLAAVAAGAPLTPGVPAAVFQPAAGYPQLVWPPTGTAAAAAAAGSRGGRTAAGPAATPVGTRQPEKSVEEGELPPSPAAVAGTGLPAAAAAAPHSHSKARATAGRTADVAAMQQNRSGSRSAPPPAAASAAQPQPRAQGRAVPGGLLPDAVLPFAEATAANEALAQEGKHVGRRAASAAAAAGKGPVIIKRNPYQNWKVLADAATTRRLIAMYVPGAEGLSRLVKQGRNSPQLAQLTIQNDVPQKWEYSKCMVVQEAQLLDESGLRAALRLQEPAPLRRRLDKALEAELRSGRELRTFFWAAHGMFLEEWQFEACCPPNKQDTAAELRECVLHRVQLAKLLIMMHNLLLRGAVAQQGP